MQLEGRSVSRSIVTHIYVTARGDITAHPPTCTCAVVCVWCVLLSWMCVLVSEDGSVGEEDEDFFFLMMPVLAGTT